MPAIKITSKTKIELDIIDEENTVRGKVSFDPNDMKTYNAFTEIANSITAIQDKYTESKDALNISEGKLESVDEYKQARDKLGKISDLTSCAVEQIQKITERIDSVFGAGASELILQGSYDVELLAEFIQGVMPYFTEAKEKRLGKYIDDSAEGSEVM